MQPRRGGNPSVERPANGRGMDPKSLDRHHGVGKHVGEELLTMGYFMVALNFPAFCPVRGRLTFVCSGRKQNSER